MRLRLWFFKKMSALRGPKDEDERLPEDGSRTRIKMKMTRKAKTKMRARTKIWPRRMRSVLGMRWGDEEEDKDDVEDEDEDGKEADYEDEDEGENEDRADEDDEVEDEGWPSWEGCRMKRRARTKLNI